LSIFPSSLRPCWLPKCRFIGRSIQIGV